MSSFLLLLHSPRYACQSSQSALQFAQAIMAQGHELKAIFFYQNAVEHANVLSLIPSDELDTSLGFKQLNQQYGIPLLLCVTAAEKRGVLDERQAERAGLDAHNLDPAYTIAGLAEMAALATTVDRVVQFK